MQLPPLTRTTSTTTSSTPAELGRGRDALQPSKAAVDLRISLSKGSTSLPWRYTPVTAPEHELSNSEVLEGVRTVSGLSGSLVIGGRAPLQRDGLHDLLKQLAALRQGSLGLCLTGHGLTKSIAKELVACGVQRVILPFHSGRQDAHDWLVGQPGALKIAHRAIGECLDAGLAVCAEALLTRSTAVHLAETIEVLAHSGVRNVCARRLTAAEAPGAEFVPLSPRISGLEGALETAAALSVKRRVRLILRDLPQCTAPRLRAIFAPADSEVWIQGDGSRILRTTADRGCPTCPGAPQCSGAPADYVARFGWEEFADTSHATVRVAETVEEQKIGKASQPMTLTWRGPHRVLCASCGDARPLPAQEPYENTRSFREYLVQAACYRPARLRLVGADLLAHPQAAQLIYDAIRLFPYVEVAGEASAIVAWSDLDMRRIKDLQRLDVALYGPDAATHDTHCGIAGAFAAMQEGIERLRSQTSIAIGAYAILHDAAYISSFAEAWNRGELPGEPRFRLSTQGGDLDELAECARAMAPGPARTALLSTLPYCLYELATNERPTRSTSEKESQQTIYCGRSVSYEPCGSDPLGIFEPCPTPSCAAQGCPGIAKGWRSAERSTSWKMNI